MLDQLLEKSVILCNDGCIDPITRLCQPLVVTTDECDDIVTSLDDCCDGVGKRLGRLGSASASCWTKSKPPPFCAGARAIPAMRHYQSVPR